MLGFVESALAFVFVLGVLVILHEAGHFAAARLVGAPVEVFSVGFGKRIWGFERNGTDYRLSLIPLGGYVRVVGLGPDESEVVGSGASGGPLLARWKRAVILVAGPLTNILAAVGFLASAYVIGVEAPRYLAEPPVVGWIDPGSPAAAADVEAGDFVQRVDGARIANWRDLDTAILTAGGQPVTLTIDRGGARHQIVITPETVTRYRFGYAGLYPPLEPVVVQLVKGAPAERAGLRAGDRILTVNGQRVDQFWDLIRIISPLPEHELTLEVDRGGTAVTLEMVAQNDAGEGKIGIAVAFPTKLERLAPGAALVAGVHECRRVSAETFRVIGRLITRKTSMRQVSGPIDIARISGEAARGGFRTLVWFLGLISLQLGILNLLPIPVLDGGHLTILAFESTIRRDLSIKVKERILEVGFYLLILLMVVVLFNDIIKNLPEGMYNLISGG